MARWCAAAVLALLCACSDSEEPALDAQAWRADCLAQVDDLEAAALAAEARAGEALLGITPEAAEVLLQAGQKLARANRRAAEIVREACRASSPLERVGPS